MIMPSLNDLDINVLVALGNQTDSVFTRNYIKLLLVEKIFVLNYAMFFLINKFLCSDKILREVYAEVIIMKMKDNEYYIDEAVLDEILKLVSLDTLMNYGAESSSLDFSMKCKEEFWMRAKEIEDKVELNRKRNLDKGKLRNLFNVKKKGE